MEQAVVKILLLGICGYGSNYIKEISERDIPGIKIEGICEVVPNAADLYPIIKEQNIPIYQTPEDFYKEHTADLAVVSTPIHLHYSQIVTCLTHGSNVLTEKPVCTSVEGAHKLEQLEKETGKFISVGYQLNYSRDVLALKHDILDDHFGKPIYMKALHAMRRGDKYYARNSWAGHIDVKGCAVNDSPFNNACAHQFQVMTFLLGERLERAAELADVQAEPYKGNPNVDNFDTITVLAHGKLLQAADGRWFLCFLCLRRNPDGTAPMGRETSIAEVTWTPDGWPVAAYGCRPRAVLNMPFSEEIPTLTPVGITRWKGEEWITQRALDTANFTVEKDALTLCGNGLDLCDRKMQGLLLVRQQERAFTAETALEIPAAGTAGLTCYYDEHSYLKFGVGPEGLVLEEYAGYEAVSRQTAPLPAGTSPVRLRVTATGGQRHFAIQDGTDWRTLWSIPEPHYLTSEGLQCGKRFTGAMVGLYVHGASAVRFTDWSAVWSCPEEKR